MNRTRCFQTFVIFAVLALSAYLRIYNVSIFPGWYNDEGTVINIAQNLAKGRVEYLGVQESILIAARQPLFVWILSFIFRIFGDGITVLRIFTGILGVLSTLVIILIFLKKDYFLAVISAFAYAVLPDAVITTRIGFSYNLASFFGILGFLFAFLYYETGLRGYGIASAFILGLGFSSELAALIFLPALLILVVMKRWQDLFSIIFVFFLPQLIYLLIMIITAPNALVYDLRFLTYRLNDIPLLVKIILFLMNTITYSQRVFFVLGLLGILVFRDQSTKKILVTFTLVPFFIAGSSDTLGSVAMYKLIPLYPFIAIGIGLLVYEVIHMIHNLSISLIDSIERKVAHLKKNSRSFLVAVADMALIFPFLITPVICIMINLQLQLTPQDMVGSFFTGFDKIPALIQIVKNPFTPVLLNVDEAKATANYVNDHASNNDLILASPAIAWAIDGNVTDYVLSLAYDGQDNLFFPTNIPQSRFRFCADYKEARYIIVDNIWKNFFELNMPSMDNLNSEIDEMVIAFRTRSIIVYERVD